MLNGVHYFFDMDVKASLRNVFSQDPEIDIEIDSNEEVVTDDDPLLDSAIYSDFYSGSNYISSTSMSELCQNIISYTNLLPNP